MEELGPVVVAHGVEALALFVQPVGFEVRVEDAFLAVERPGEVVAFGPEDRAAAAAEQVVAVEQVAEREVVGVRSRTLVVGGRDDERARLPRDVHERRLPGVAVVGGGGDVDLDPGLVE